MTFTMETLFYGRPTFTPYNFFRTNILHNISAFYGANVWHFYFVGGVAFLSLGLLPWVLDGIYLSFRKNSSVRVGILRSSAIWTMAVLSLITHKEHRFIQPLLPILHVLAASSIVHRASLHMQAHPGSKGSRSISGTQIKLILAINIPAALIFAMAHMRGQVAVTTYLHRIPQTSLKSVGFLMPCHSTPWQSHLHLPHLEVEGVPSGYGGKLWALSCEPPLQ